MPGVTILQAAAAEGAAAAAWYESQQPGLGSEFEAALQAALDLLETPVAPLVAVPGPAGARGAMRIVLRRFPFDVVVVPARDGWLIVAFAHHSRRPGYWRDRTRRRT